MGGRAKRGGRAALLFITILAVVLAAILCVMLFLEMRGENREPVYQHVSMSEEAAARAYVWLAQIDDMPLSYTEIRKMMGTIELTLKLTPTEEKGIYTRSPEEGSFEDCAGRAQSGLEAAYREVLKYRMIAAGYEGMLTDDALDEMMKEAYGVTVSEYLALCGVELLPAKEELREMYSGEVTYE